MDRRSFGNWGPKLGNGQFAKALAIVGLHNAASGAWPMPDDPRGVAEAIAQTLVKSDAPMPCKFFVAPPDEWVKFARIPSATAAVEAWEELLPLLNGRPKFEVTLDDKTRRGDDRAGAGWILDQLRHPALKAASVFLNVPSVMRNVDWHETIRIGLLGEAAWTAYKMARRLSPTDDMTAPLDVTRERGTVDLLWMTQGVTEAARAIENALYPIHAHAVAINGDSSGANWSSIEQAKTRILELTQAHAVAIAGEVEPSDWLNRVISELRGGGGFSVAIERSGGTVFPVTNGPLLWCSRALIEATKIHAAVDQLLEFTPDSFSPTDGELESVAPPGPTPERPSYVRGHKPPPRSAPKPPPAAPPPSRHLQVGVFNECAEPVTAFTTGALHLIEVHIGPVRADRRSLRDAFPEKELPPTDRGGHLLTIVFFEPQAMERPQLKTIFLPDSGPSNPCRFEFQVPESAKRIEGRVTVLHENRVLQTGIVQGPVLSRQPVEGAGSLAHIEFVIAGVVPRAAADLDQRSRFDAAFVLNHVGDRPGLQATAGNLPGYVWLDDITIQESKEGIDKALDTGDWDFDSYNGLHAEGTTELLRQLALMGNNLFVEVGAHLPPSVMKAKRLQVVIAKDHARFPVEFFYEFNPPADDAPVCPHAADALRTGSCSAACDSLKETPAPVVCPLGFWGLNRIIEWHVFTQEGAMDIPAHAAARLDIDSAPKSGQVKLGGPCLFAYSKQIDKADKDSVPNFKIRAQQLAHLVPVESWKDWRAAVQAHDPSLLMLLVHTKKDPTGTLLEMGPPSATAEEKEYLLRINYLTREDVIGPNITGTPIVLLLGCTTNRAKLAFESISSAFERRGKARIIVSTANLIYGPKAVELAETFLRELQKVEDGQTFGEVMLRVRRSALADGISMILCVSAYGDADWKLVKG
jgi:hypothetical protein